MAKFTAVQNPFTGTTAPAGVTMQEVSLDINTFPLSGVNITTYGLRAFPTTLSGNLPRIMFVRGGTTGAGNALDDDLWDFMDDFAAFGDTTLDAGSGYMVYAPLLRGAIAQYTSGGTSGGTDEWCGADLWDLANWWSTAKETGVSDADTYGAGSTGGIVGMSAGAARVMCALAQNKVMADAVVLRSPLIDIRSWDEFKAMPGNTASTQDTLTAMIPSWTSASDTDYADLTSYEQNQLQARSVVNFIDRLPTDTKYLFQVAEEDGTIDFNGVKHVLDKMVDKGLKVDMDLITAAGHGFSTTDDEAASSASMRKFFGRHLRLAR